MKELNFEQMAQIEGGFGTPCPGGHVEDMSWDDIVALTVETMYGVIVIRNSSGQIVCYEPG